MTQEERFRKNEGGEQLDLFDTPKNKWTFRLSLIGIALLALTIAFGQPEHISRVYLYIAGN